MLYTGAVLGRAHKVVQLFTCRRVSILFPYFHCTVVVALPSPYPFRGYFWSLPVAIASREVWIPSRVAKVVLLLHALSAPCLLRHYKKIRPVSDDETRHNKLKHGAKPPGGIKDVVVP